MIANLYDSPRKPARVVVLGAGGFIGGGSDPPSPLRGD